MAFLSTVKHVMALRLALACCMALGSLAHAATVKAYVKSNKVRPNRMFVFTIEIQDGAPDAYPDLRLPLQIGQNTAVNTAQQGQLGAGGIKVTTQLSWGLAASEPGDFVIPPQNVSVGGQVLTTNEVKLTVEQGGNGQQEDDDGNKPLLQIELGRKEIYQGEVVPVTCSIFVPRSTPLRRLGGLIDIEKSDFAIARFPQQGEQSETVIDGVGYLVITFRSTLSSLRTGELKVGPASMEILIEVPVQGVRRQDLFQPDFFGVPTEPRKVTVKSQQVTLKVLPLPAEGKPASFSGAVGDFSLSASATPTELTVGDPVAVELNVEGTGNFDALTTPALTQPSGWKSYPAKRYNVEGQLDQNQMPTLERKIGYSQVFIPEAVHSTLPPFEMSFFSSSQKRYVTLRTEAIPLNMKPAAPATVVNEVNATGAGDAQVPPPVVDPRVDITDIVINSPTTSRWVAPTGILLMHSRQFWTVQAVPVGLLVLASFLAVLRRRRERSQGGRAGELRSAWSALEKQHGGDREFLHQAAQFIYTVKAGEPVEEPELKEVLARYETSNFSVGEAPPVTAGERRKMTDSLNGLYRKALARTTVGLLLIAGLWADCLQAQDTSKSADTPDEAYRDAVAEMDKGNFSRAQYLAEALTKKKPPQLSPEIFQLIGHARYRQEDLGRAVLWYQRAQLLDGRSPELRQNLRHLFEKLRFISFPQKTVLADLSLRLTLNEWTLAAAGGFWLVILSLAWRVWRGRRAWGLALTVGLVGLLIAAPATAMAALRPSTVVRVRDIALVTVPDVRLFTAATVTSGTVIDLPPGSQVKMLKKRGGWSYVEVAGEPDNLRGWVEGGAISPLWPWEESLIP